MSAVVAPEAPDFAVEEFWDDLLAYIEDGRVIPVIGRELLSVQVGGEMVPLYRELAQRLLRRYGISATLSDEDSTLAAAPPAITLRDHRELSDAVYALIQRGRKPQDLYRPVSDLLKAIIAEQSAMNPALLDLASIRKFDLFATTSPDDLFARAIEIARGDLQIRTDEIEYAPGLPSSKIRDLAETRPEGYAAVFYIFGKACASPVYAIHEEDFVEFIHGLQSGRGPVPEKLFAELRSRNLLLIGCHFPDWLSRFFIRLSMADRLSAADRPTREFLVGWSAGSGGSLTMFLECFSQNTRFFPGTAREFVAELARRWRERHPPVAQAAMTVGRAESMVPASEALPDGDIFISYSSTDLPAARRLADQIKEIGGDVVWFDKSRLTPGVDWESQIMAGVRRCSLFLPLLSRSADQRTEGYFRGEWNEAAERSKRIQGKKFILPVVIDPDYSGNMAAYQNVPERFTQFQYSVAPGGTLSDPLKTELVEQLRALRRARPA
jgi:hypothetical protein